MHQAHVQADRRRGHVDARFMGACGTDPDGSTSLLALTLGTSNHIRRPSNWTEEMLRFLSRHPLGPP